MLKRVRAFLIELELEVLVFKEREKLEFPEKNLSKQGREPTTSSTHIMASKPGFEPRATWVGGECSHHCATLAL